MKRDDSCELSTINYYSLTHFCCLSFYYASSNNNNNNNNNSSCIIYILLATYWYYTQAFNFINLHADLHMKQKKKG